MCRLLPGASSTPCRSQLLCVLMCACCRDAYEQQLAAAGGDAAAVGVSLPSGIVVFRRGKLALRPGMDEAQFAEAVVYQAAAQLALSSMGYKFDDA